METEIASCKAWPKKHLPQMFFCYALSYKVQAWRFEHTSLRINAKNKQGSWIKVFFWRQPLATNLHSPKFFSSLNKEDNAFRFCCCRILRAAFLFSLGLTKMIGLKSVYRTYQLLPEHRIIPFLSLTLNLANAVS